MSFLQAFGVVVMPRGELFLCKELFIGYYWFAFRVVLFSSVLLWMGSHWDTESSSCRCVSSSVMGSTAGLGEPGRRQSISQWFLLPRKFLTSPPLPLLQSSVEVEVKQKRCYSFPGSYSMALLRVDMPIRLPTARQWILIGTPSKKNVGKRLRTGCGVPICGGVPKNSFLLC